MSLLDQTIPVFNGGAKVREHRLDEKTASVAEFGLITIKPGIPLPVTSKQSITEWGRVFGLMNIGDSFSLPTKNASSAHTARHGRGCADVGQAHGWTGPACAGSFE